ncbi:head-tail connector protein [uncultured Sphingomonas sp.]|uniref:head-tail connector protein n=1 Tax=uncultured Sphingomonas sp. TaxID=158754 RepID=UPI0025DF5B2B|nr:head-tail connector protein [uncultured Sphingomonas sp.]
MAQVKADDADTQLVKALRASAIDWVERYTACALSRRQFVWSPDRVDCRLTLPRGVDPVIESVEAFDERSASVPLDAAAWRLAGAALVLVSNRVPRATQSIRVVFTAGFENVAEEAPSLVTACLMMLAHFYRNREASAAVAMSAVPFGVEALCGPFRDVVIA